MLFSNADVARMIGEQFEPTWQSVREVPTVSIDFGAGTKLTRTLHGNVATYVCAPDGEVLDVIGGIYEPVAYRGRLGQAARLATRYAARPAAERDTFLRATHQRVARRIDTLLTGRPDPSKRRSEIGTESVFLDVPRPTRAAQDAKPTRRGAPDLDAIARDTRHNEHVRRPKILAILSTPGPHTVSSLTKRVYRDVLGTDLDDPYLGLGDALFAAYPFER